MPAPLYDVLLVVHVAAAFLGFGSLAVAGIVASSGRRSKDPAADERLRRFFREGTDWPELLIFLVPLLGLSLLLGGDTSAVSMAWPWVGLAIWAVAAGVVTGLLRPAERRAQALLTRACAGDAEAAGGFLRACARMEQAAAVTSLLFVAAVAVMILQP